MVILIAVVMVTVMDDSFYRDGDVVGSCVGSYPALLKLHGRITPIFATVCTSIFQYEPR